MHIKQERPFEDGYTPIVDADAGLHPDMLFDFGILVLNAGETWTSIKPETERAYLLLDGKASLKAERIDVDASRSSLLDEGPSVLHVAGGTAVTIRAQTRCELAVERCATPAVFEPVYYGPENCRSERFGEGTMQETSTRTVRTVFDAATHEASGMVLGEVINHPGKWSSYPPHSHAHPEVYHFRFIPEQGFGFSQAGDTVAKVTHRDTVTIPGGVVHPQTAAPGYAMYYIWMIPHLPDDRFGPDSRIFEKEHLWVTDPHATIWPDI